MGEFILETRNLTKVYNIQQENEFEALRGIDFQARSGEFVCVMGPSGSGKTTFLNNISTMDMPTRGQVLLDGTDIRSMSANALGRFRSRNLGFVFQEFNLLDTHTLYENIALPMALAGEKAEVIRSRVTEAAGRMGIDGILDKYPGECSGGQRQRAAICRALIMGPRILVADEPTGNLDSGNSREFLSMIRQMNEERGVTVIMVTHDPLIASYSQRLVYIRDGRIEQEIRRGEMSQKEYFDRIAEINARESREMLL